MSGFLHRAASTFVDGGEAIGDAASGAVDFVGDMGNSFMQDLAGGAVDPGQGAGYMHSDLLRELMGGPGPAAAPLERDIPYDASQPWSDEGLRSRLHYQYQGSDGQDLIGSKPLTNTMNTLAEPEPDGSDPKALAAWQERQRTAAIELGSLRGQTEEEALAGYDKFRTLQADQARRREELGLDPVEALSPERADHMGSIQQLRSGSYVGQALGVDDVYGALLNPTGGMVGEGNEGYRADPDSVASYHGEAHDAFGYLQNYHDVGPGYTYATPDTARRYGGNDPVSLRPYTGQASGFRKWNDLMAQEGMADPVHPGDPDSQMRDSLRELDHGGLVDPLAPVGGQPPGMFDPQIAFPDPVLANPLIRDVDGTTDFVESVIHGIGELTRDPSRWLM